MARGAISHAGHERALWNLQPAVRVANGWKIFFSRRSVVISTTLCKGVAKVDSLEIWESFHHPNKYQINSQNALGTSVLKLCMDSASLGICKTNCLLDGSIFRTLRNNPWREIIHKQVSWHFSILQYNEQTFPHIPKFYISESGLLLFQIQSSSFRYFRIT